MARPLSNAIEELAGRRRWTGEEARTVLEAASRSGLPLLRFAAEHGIEPHRLYRWRQQLSARAPAKVGFAEIAFAAPVAAATERLELVLRSGEVIRIGAHFDAATLKRLLTVLEDRAARC